MADIKVKLDSKADEARPRSAKKPEKINKQIK